MRTIFTRPLLRRALLSLMLAESFLLLLLRVLGLDGQALPAGGLCAGLILLWLFLPAGRWPRAGLLLGLAGLAAWQGVPLLNGLWSLLAFLRGTEAGLTLFGLPAALLLAAILALLGLLSTADRFGPLVAWGLGLGVLALMIGLQRQAFDGVWLLIPGAAALLLILSDTLSGFHRSLRKTLPLMLCVSALAFGLLPLLGQWMPFKPQADQLRQRIQDLLFYTEPRSVFDLEMAGWMPLGRDRMGGVPQPSDALVMTVRTPRRTYLRGAVKDAYNGLAWRDTIGGRRYLWYLARWQSARDRLFNESLPPAALRLGEPLREHTVDVRMNAASASSLFVPQRVRRLDARGDLVPYFNESSEAFITRDLAPGDSYSALAPLPIAGEAGLGEIISGCAASADPLFEDVRRLYTGLPGHLQDSLYELARQITSGWSEPYDRARAIESWLRANCVYSLDAELPEDQVDFVSWFLLRTRAGYCTHFASVMTVLCRMAGLPARYVEGYLATPGADGVALVTGREAHAWTEVYFSGFGWLTFDATAPRDEPDAPPQDAEDNPPPAPAAPEEPPTPTPAPSPEPTDAPENELDTEDPEDPAEDSRRFPWWIFLLLLLLLIAAICFRVLRTAPRREAARAKSEAARWRIWAGAAFEALAALGLRRRPEESPAAFLRRAGAEHPVAAPLDALGDTAARVFYGRQTPDRVQTETAKTCCEALWKSLRRRDRLRLRLRRAFARRAERRVLA